MDDSKWERWSALGGILFVVLVVAAAVLPGEPPKPGDPAIDVSRWVTDNEQALRWAAYLSALAAVPLLWWLGGLWRMMRRAEGGSPRLAVAALGGAVFSGALSVAASVVLSTVAIYGARELGSGIRFFYLLSTGMSGAALLGIAVFVGSISALAIRTQVLPAALGWFGALVALAAVLGGAMVASTRDEYFVLAMIAYIGASLWILITSVIMLRGQREPEAAAVAA
jgi:hypothetical protein